MSSWEAGRFFYRTLTSPEGRAGLDYFRGRGLDGAIIKRFGLGYAPESGFGLVNHLRKKGYTQEELTGKAHNYQLEEAPYTVLCVDYRQSGIGSASCGPDLSEEYRLIGENMDFEVRMKPECR